MQDVARFNGSLCRLNWLDIQLGDVQQVVEQRQHVGGLLMDVVQETAPTRLGQARGGSSSNSAMDLTLPIGFRRSCATMPGTDSSIRSVGATLRSGAQSRLSVPPTATPTAFFDDDRDLLGQAQVGVDVRVGVGVRKPAGEEQKAHRDAIGDQGQVSEDRTPSATTSAVDSEPGLARRYSTRSFRIRGFPVARMVLQAAAFQRSRIASQKLNLGVLGLGPTRPDHLPVGVDQAQPIRS